MPLSWWKCNSNEVCDGAWLCCVLLIGPGLSPSAIAQTTVTYIHTDALGSAVAESDANGNVIKHYDYEPYGAVVGGQVTDGPGYTGHVSDSATSLSYMQQRYMDPQLGVFLSADPVTAYEQSVGQFNRYRYGNGNPYKFKDFLDMACRGLYVYDWSGTRYTLVAEPKSAVQCSALNDELKSIAEFAVFDSIEFSRQTDISVGSLMEVVQSTM